MDMEVIDTAIKVDNPSFNLETQETIINSNDPTINIEKDTTIDLQIKSEDNHIDEVKLFSLEKDDEKDGKLEELSGETINDDIQYHDNSYGNLNKIPKKLMYCKNLTRLILKHNNIELLPINFFINLGNLEWFDIRWNNLSHLKETKLFAAKNLETFLLNYNNFEEIPLELCRLGKLKHLQFSGNVKLYQKYGKYMRKGLGFLKIFMANKLGADSSTATNLIGNALNDNHNNDCGDTSNEQLIDCFSDYDSMKIRSRIGDRRQTSKLLKANSSLNFNHFLSNTSRRSYSASLSTIDIRNGKIDPISRELLKESLKIKRKKDNERISRILDKRNTKKELHNWKETYRMKQRAIANLKLRPGIDYKQSPNVAPFDVNESYLKIKNPEEYEEFERIENILAKRPLSPRSRLLKQNQQRLKELEIRRRFDTYMRMISNQREMGGSLEDQKMQKAQELAQLKKIKREIDERRKEINK
ncbi:hypothetical protein SNEBB_006603 [Seison nebaliae]|nr:hypothetical protein SNEBB_006603 [Seison nebaliae]